MQIQRSPATVLALCTGLVCLAAEGQERRFLIEESTDFTGNGCPNDDLNTVTASLKTAMESGPPGYPWTGYRFVNRYAWPQDVMEATFDQSFMDDDWGDWARVTIIAGHGGQGANQIQWGFPHNGVCQVFPSVQVRLGTLGGGNNSVLMQLNSCQGTYGTMNMQYAQGRNGQVLAYHNSPAIFDNQPRDFYNATYSTINVNAWLFVMDDKAGGGWNSPMVFSQGADALDAWYRHNYMQMAEYVWMHVMGTSQGSYNFSWLDNGCGPCVGGFCAS